jgi:hypothetical protein
VAQAVPNSLSVKVTPKIRGRFKFVLKVNIELEIDVSLTSVPELPKPDLS